MFQNAQVSDSPTDMDKWLALVVGNLLHDDVPEDRNFFNGMLEFPEHLFDMIKGWNYSMGNSAPFGTKSYFKGISLSSKKEIDLQYLDLAYLDFSYSRLENLNIAFARLNEIDFSHCIFIGNIRLSNSFIYGINFKNIDLTDANFDVDNSSISIGILFPNYLAEKLNPNMISFYKRKTYIIKVDVRTIFTNLIELLIYGLKNNLFNIPEIKSWFDYERDEDRKEFESLIDGLKDV